MTGFRVVDSLRNLTLTGFGVHLALLNSALTSFGCVGNLVNGTTTWLSGHAALLDRTCTGLRCVANLLNRSLANFVATERYVVGVRLVNHLTLHCRDRNFLSDNVWNPNLFANGSCCHGRSGSTTISSRCSATAAWCRSCTATTASRSITVTGRGGTATNSNFFHYSLVRAHILGARLHRRDRVRAANLSRTSTLFRVRDLDSVRLNFVGVHRDLNCVRNLFVCINRNLYCVRNLFLRCDRNGHVVSLNYVNVGWNLNGVVDGFHNGRRNRNRVVLNFRNRLAYGNLVRDLFDHSRWNLNGISLNLVVVDGFVDGVWHFFSDSAWYIDLVRFFNLASDWHVNCVANLLGLLLWNHNRAGAGLGFSAWNLLCHCVSACTSFHFGSVLGYSSHFGDLRWHHDRLFDVAHLCSATHSASIPTTYNSTTHHAARSNNGGSTAPATAIRKNITGPKQHGSQPKGITWAKLHRSLLEVKNWPPYRRPVVTLTLSVTNKMQRL